MSRARRRGPRWIRILLPAGVVLLLCAGFLGRHLRRQAHRPPNVLWVVWDAVRADRLSLYGNRRPTTPFLDQWSKQARVFDNCLSVSNTTVPTHASWFTDLLPFEHGADNVHCFLREELRTLPEIFREHGYGTFLYSENPLISKETGFGQGFDRIVHPWSAEYRERAASILENKIPPRVRNPQLGSRLREKDISLWALSACGQLGEASWLEWLKGGGRDRPFFAFFNYMEAHAPVITPIAYRQRMLSEEAVTLSYTMNLTPARIWQYVFGLIDFSNEELAAIQGTYDASLAEMDDLFKSLLGALEKTGGMKNTIVVLVSDHGEYLGEHHLLDHQFALYRQVREVPLVLFSPGRVPPGRDPSPVMNIDLYPTILELAGIQTAESRAAALPSGEKIKPFSVSLLHPQARRIRTGGYPAVPEAPFADARLVAPDFDPAPYRRTQRFLQEDSTAYILSSDGNQELYLLDQDPMESRNLAPTDPQGAARMFGVLGRVLSGRPPIMRHSGPGAVMTPEQKEVLRSLGYIGASD